MRNPEHKYRPCFSDDDIYRLYQILKQQKESSMGLAYFCEKNKIPKQRMYGFKARFNCTNSFPKEEREFYIELIKKYKDSFLSMKEFAKREQLTKKQTNTLTYVNYWYSYREAIKNIEQSGRTQEIMDNLYVFDYDKYEYCNPKKTIQDNPGFTQITTNQMTSDNKLAQAEANNFTSIPMTPVQYNLNMDSKNNPKDNKISLSIGQDVNITFALDTSPDKILKIIQLLKDL